MRALLWGLALVLLAGPATAQPDTLLVDARVSPSVVKIGERVRIDIGFEAPEPDVRFLGPPAPVAFGPLDVVTSGPRPAGADSVGWTLELAFFRLGELNVNVIPFALETSAGTIPVRLRPYTISVVSVLPDTLQNAEIRDIKGPLEVPVRLRWGRVALAGLALALLVAGVLVWRRRRRPAERIAPYVPPVPPETAALRALRELEEAALPARGLIKEHYARLSLILREYMESRFRVPAVESTTDEIRSSLAGRRLFPETRTTSLLTLLEEADLVKFAKADPGPEAAGTALEGGRSWVEQGAPRMVEGEA